jgi:hypothetical protein
MLLGVDVLHPETTKWVGWAVGRTCYRHIKQ